MDKQGVISLGEAFVDYISINQTNTKYQRLLGGATVNVAVGASRLGIPSYYLCKLGKDETSEFVKDELKKANVNTDYCVVVPDKKVCGVYVHLKKNGERSFHSYLNPTPDEVLTADQLQKSLFEQAKVFYFGSGTLFHPIAKKTTEKALIYAKEANTLVAFDANLRLKRWENEELCRKTVTSFLSRTDIVKLAEDELCFLTETSSLEAGITSLSKLQIPYLFVTVGSKGAYAVVNGKSVHVPGIKAKIVDTTGAGDAFMAALLYRFHDQGFPKDLPQMIEFTKHANEIGALAATKFGSLTDF